MAGQSRTTWARRVAPVVVVLLLAACSADGPTVDEAGRALKSHILALLKERNAQDVTITDPGGKNISCGEDTARQTFAATGRDLANHTDPEALNTLMLGSLKAVAPYELISADAQGQPIRVVNKTTKTILIFESPGYGLYVVRGETECLPTS